MSSGRTFVVPCKEWVKKEPVQLMVPGHEDSGDRTQYHCMLKLEVPPPSLRPLILHPHRWVLACLIPARLHAEPDRMPAGCG